MGNVTPINYTIHIEPNLRTFNFSGTSQILLQTSNSVDEITLNARELAFWECTVRVDTASVACPFTFDPQKEEVKVSLPNRLDGRIVLTILYEGKINDRLVGFYRSTYRVAGKEKFCALTQFEESEARRAFPCFDHPAKKATFDIELLIDEGLIAISNEPIAGEKKLPHNKTLVTFRQTPKMSTYLVFFAVGEFESIEDEGEVPVRVITMPGMVKHAQFGLEFGRKALEFCEDYYGIPYPLPKLDLIAIPDFAAGAMENWGAITFRENLLLHYANITSKAGEQRICEVIAHEIAHQWFGNLVTPSDWRYLWLNESFATYFGYSVVTRYYPEWDLWHQFLHGITDRALDRDALKETFSIELPDEKHIAINPSTAPIIYNKGGSILRQVEGYIGNSNFKEGLRNYLKKHRYASASSPDLWKALEGVSEQPISAIMKSWIEQPGFPLVEVTREADNLILTQRRFTYLPTESDQLWIIPVTINVYREGSRSQLITTLLTDKSTRISIGESSVAYKVNYGQSGFYRVKYQEGKNLVEFGKRIRSKDLPAEDRWGLQNDLYALVRGGQASLNDYLQFLSFYEDEDAFLPLISIAGNLFHAYLIFEGPERSRVATVGKSLLETVLSRIGYDPAQDERPTTSILRDYILVHSVLYGSGNGTDFARGKLSSLMRGRSIHPDIMKSIMQVGALYGDMKAFKWFDKRLRTSQSEHERINILLALGSFRDEEVIKEVQRYVLTAVPQKNKFIPVDSLASNPHAIPGLWEWFVSNVAALKNFHPIQYERIIEAVVPVSGIGKEEQVHSFFENYLKENDKAKDVIQLSLEKLEINSRMRHGSYEPRRKA